MCYPKAVGKLRKAAESAKDILSANAKYQVGIESIHEEHDLRMILTREAFEAEAEKRGLWRRLVPPLEAALASANLTKDEIHKVSAVSHISALLPVLSPKQPSPSDTAAHIDRSRSSAARPAS